MICNYHTYFSLFVKPYKASKVFIIVHHTIYISINFSFIEANTLYLSHREQIFVNYLFTVKGNK